ncbi:DnaJ domain-containing protein [Paraburkholderia denitrificans]|uniref:DnaJ domain-containing protein n=1 Tax=Paraburkholderia denitrificans TaxID=694025 RepID=A0ABW0JBY8_9BURK
MANRDPGHPVDYDRLYYRLDLEPGASAAEITRKYRQLAQILHPDKWRHSTPAQQHWANEQFKNMKHAREVLDRYWSEHHEAPSSHSTPGREQIETLHAALRQLQTQRERVRVELGALHMEKVRGLDELLRMKAERDALLTELVSLHDQAARGRAQAAQLRDQVMADAAHPVDGAPQQHGAARVHLNDPRYVWLFSFGAIVAVFFALYLLAHKLVAMLFAPFALHNEVRWLASLLQWALVMGGAVLVYGNGWALYTLHRAQHAGQERIVPLPPDQLWQRVLAALRGQERSGVAWSIESCEIAPDDSALELRAVMRLSPRRRRAAARTHRHIVTFRCRARAAGASQTALRFGFDVAAPIGWRVPVASAVGALCTRLADDLARRPTDSEYLPEHPVKGR